MSRHAIFLLLAVGAMSPSAFGAAEEYRPIEALLQYPRPDAVDVPPTTRLFAIGVTAVSLEGLGGERLPTTLDQSRPYGGSVFVPLDDLAPGQWTVKGLPTSEAENWAGDGVAIDLGSFTVAEGAVPAPLTAEVTSARWSISSRSRDWLSIDVRVGDGQYQQPVFLELDIADADRPMDGEPELESDWWRTSVRDYLDEEATGIDPYSAMVRVRATDAAGNVSEWSAPSAFEVETMRVASGCSAAPGTSGGTGAVAALLGLALGLAARRHPRRTRRQVQG